MKPIFALSLFGFLQLLSGCAHQNDWALQPGSGDPDIQAILRDVSYRYKIVGMGAGIVRPTGETDIAVVGWNKAGDEVPIELNNLWHLGSCSKAITATLAAKLVEEGKLHWHSTLAEVFPGLAEKLDPAKRGITLEQLLSHRSGLSRDPSLLVYVSNLWQSPSRQRFAVLRQVPRAKLVGPPDAQYAYSNFGYILAGTMIETVTGQQFEDVMRTQLFEPLNMQSPEYEGTHAYGKNGVIWSHKSSGRPVPRSIASIGDPPSLRPAGCIRSSLCDWARFIWHHLVGETDGSDYLLAESFCELHRSRGDNYALGWRILKSDLGDSTLLKHAGSNRLNYAAVWVAPRREFAVFACANQGKSRQAIDDVVSRLIDLVSN